MNSIDSLVSSNLPELVVRGTVHDDGNGLVLTCGLCGGETRISKITEVKVYAHDVHMVIAFDLAAMIRSGEYSLSCETCTNLAGKQELVVVE